jgi:hypothetical protein
MDSSRLTKFHNHHHHHGANNNNSNNNWINAINGASAGSGGNRIGSGGAHLSSSSRHGTAATTAAAYARKRSMGIKSLALQKRGGGVGNSSILAAMATMKLKSGAGLMNGLGKNDVDELQSHHESRSSSASGGSPLPHPGSAAGMGKLMAAKLKSTTMAATSVATTAAAAAEGAGNNHALAEDGSGNNTGNPTTPAAAGGNNNATTTTTTSTAAAGNTVNTSSNDAKVEDSESRPVTGKSSMYKSRYGKS